MANLTLAIDDNLLQAARVRAVKEGTSVNEVCRRAIENYARAEGRKDWLQRYAALSTGIAAARAGRPVKRVAHQTRAQIHDEVLDERMPTYLAGKPRRT